MHWSQIVLGIVCGLTLGAGGMVVLFYWTFKDTYR